MNLCGVVVWYNPSISEVNNIKTYGNKINKLIIIDNSSSDNSYLLKNINNINIQYVPNFNNLGIAKALNDGCHIAYEENYEWILTMDQDSYFNQDDFDKYLNLFKKKYEEDTMIKSFSILTDIDEEAGYLNQVITSGNIINLNSLMKVGGFDNQLFIDEVDFDICYKLCQEQYKIYKFNEILLNHSLGNTQRYRILFLSFSAMNHNYIRKYYITRNRLYIKNRFPQYTQQYKKYIINDFIKVLLVEKDKIKKIKFMLKGINHYKKGIMGKLVD